MTSLPLQNWTLEQDLKEISLHGRSSFLSLKNQHILLTGGTGFIGKWLLEAIRYCNTETEDLNIQVTVLTRNPDAFKSEFPHLVEVRGFHYASGDVLNLPTQSLLSAGPFTHLIQAATDASAELNETNPLKMFETVVSGTRIILDFAAQAKISKVLHLSSGAVYGQQSKGMDFVAEDWNGSPDCLNPKNTYAEGKRASEMLCAIYAKQFGLDVSVARIFALLGPYLNLNIHFAAGNFIRDALAGKKITVSGDGRPERSYLYPSDLVVWLLAILTKAASTVAYNVGSEEAISIADLAKLTSSLVGNQGYQILGLTDSGWNPGRYVPDTAKIQKELGVRQHVNLAEAIQRTAQWNETQEIKAYIK